MKKYVIALDEGTTSARAILFDRDLNVISSSQQNFTQIYPRPGWVEQDPLELYAAQYAALCECIAKSGISPDEIAAIGIANQRETTVVWEKSTGRPVYNAIVWQCRRTKDMCKDLDGEYITAVTGLRPDAYFSATKIKWILDNVPDAKNKDLMFGTVDTWLLYKLCGVHATDETNASRTMLYDISSGCWDKKLLQTFGISEKMLPQVKKSGSFFGTAEIMGAEIPVCGIAGDQQAALFGQCCFSSGSAKATYGTGCFLLMNTGENRVSSKNGLVTSLGATLENEQTQFVLEGSVFICGAVLQWLRDGLRFFSDSADSEYFAGKVENSGGVYIVPAFSGLGAPYWDSDARGAVFGLTRGTTRDHLTRAALESIAFQAEDVLAAMRTDTKLPLSDLKVDGGAAANGLLMQFQADISNTRVILAESNEATARGAAMLAGLTCRFFPSREYIIERTRVKKVYEPDLSDKVRKEKLSQWQRALSACREF